MRQFSISILAAMSVSLACAPHTFADTVTTFWQSKLSDIEGSNFLAYAAKDASGATRYKLRFKLYETNANIATGSFGLTFDSKEGRVHLTQSEVVALISLKKSYPSILADARATSQDIYERVIDISDKVKIVINHDKRKNATKVFIHAPMASVDSPLAEDTPGVIPVSDKVLIGALEIIEEVHGKAQ
ncbi:MAG: hypothetical protein CVV27_04730 [Candidatus Melainabacteria bacterium HGW-Melainabacteria-1]|nr:MAG: hypothetical protein CVV27_04730 [Candidatus Melainabacteria bacterium HGW-Melainabacteria-1]